MKLKQFYFKKVLSTNQTALRLIKNSKCEFGLIVSETQSKGRGQYGRKWISHKGNIFMSIFYKLDKINLSISSLTKKNCFLVKNVISKYYKKKITFKLPNDLLINKKKISGILIETSDSEEGLDVVIGIGINVHMDESEGVEIDQDWGNLEENHSNKLDRNKIVQSIISKLHQLFKDYPQSGFKKYHHTFESYNLLKDKLCKVEMDRETFEGKVIGVNEAGELLVEKDREIRHLRYGEVSIREL